jgi:hypothetical protein
MSSDGETIELDLTKRPSSPATSCKACPESLTDCLRYEQRFYAGVDSWGTNHGDPAFSSAVDSFALAAHQHGIRPDTFEGGDSDDEFLPQGECLIQRMCSAAA